MRLQAYGTMYYVKSMAKSVAYYRRILGKKPRFESKEWTEFALGGHAICLHAKEKGRKYRPNGVLILSRSGIRQLFATMKRGKLKVRGLHEVHPAAWTFTLTDLSGNDVSFYGKP